MNRKEYLKQYRKKYKVRKRQVSGYLSIHNFHQLQERSKAAGRSLFQQLYQESQSYLNNQYLPTQAQMEQHRQLIIAIRKQGVNLNQLTRYIHSKRRSVTQEQIFARLTELEKLIERFIFNPPSK